MEEIESKKSWIVSLILCFFFGIFGIHNFYIKKIKIGILQLITLGGLGIWALIDLISITKQNYKDKDGNIIRKKESGSEILKFVIVFMIISVIGSSIYIFELVYKINIYKNSDFYKVLQEEPTMNVFLDDDITQKQIDEIEKNIREIDGVSTIEFISKEENFNNMKEKFKNTNMLEDLEILGEKSNIFSEYFIVKIKDQSKYEKVYEKIVKFKNVKEVTKIDIFIKQSTQIIEKINVIFILLKILIIMFIINILGKIVVIFLIYLE